MTFLIDDRLYAHIMSFLKEKKRGGYRALGVDYQTGSGTDLFKYDITMSGPIIGLGLSF